MEKKTDSKKKNLDKTYSHTMYSKFLLQKSVAATFDDFIRRKKFRDDFSSLLRMK